MSAIEETAHAAGDAGKSIPDSGQLSVDEATRATLPQTRYADAIHTALVGYGLAPDLYRTGMRREAPASSLPELYIRATWQPGNAALAPAVADHGLTVDWSHRAGWTLTAAGDPVVLPADELAAPDTVAEAALHAAMDGPACDCDLAPLPESARWEHAIYLDIALTAYDERTSG